MGFGLCNALLSQHLLRTSLSSPLLGGIKQSPVLWAGIQPPFTRDRNSRKWLALLSTDTGLTADEIVKLYGRRWDIEVFFKMAKSFLGLAKEFQSRSYDALVLRQHWSVAVTSFLNYQNGKTLIPEHWADCFTQSEMRCGRLAFRKHCTWYSSF